jgi:uncharacterized membrane protein (DUF373 family)
MKIDFRAIFDRVNSIVFSVILVILTLSIIAGVSRLLLTIGNLLAHEELTRDIQTIISNVLTLFILIELSRSLVEYFDTRRLRITFIVDATIVFILREVMIGLFEHRITPTDIYALSALLLAVTILRIGSVVLFQREQRMFDQSNVSGSRPP